MKEYTIRENTPLGFHKFTRYVWLPIIILYNLGDLVSYLEESSEIGAWSIAPFLVFYDLLGYFVIIGLCLAAFIGFFRWKSYAWTCFMIFLVFIVAYRLLTIILAAIYLPDNVTQYTTDIIASLLIAVPALKYYRKRKPLFFPSLGPTDIDNTERKSPETVIEARFCSFCGTKIEADSRFCWKCGAAVTENRTQSVNKINRV